MKEEEDRKKLQTDRGREREKDEVQNLDKRRGFHTTRDG